MSDERNRIFTERELAHDRGDLVTVTIADIALGKEPPVRDAVDWEERFGGSGFDLDERRTIMSIESREDAREWLTDGSDESDES